MPIMRLDPFRDLVAIHDRMNRLFEAALSGTDFGEEGSGAIGSWTPISDVVETDDSIVVTSEVPGLEQEKIEIKLADNVLTISGERTVDRRPDSEQYHRVERAFGPFTRSFTVPVSVDPEKISASYREGVLSVVLPKRLEAAPRKITVRVS